MLVASHIASGDQLAGLTSPPAASVEEKVVALRFLGANPAVRLEGRSLGRAKVNYVMGNDPRLPRMPSRRRTYVALVAARVARVAYVVARDDDAVESGGLRLPRERRRRRCIGAI